jgi:hypothetical protein
MRTSMDSATTTSTRSYRLEWRHLSTTNPTYNEHMLNTAEKRLSSAHPPSIIDAGSFGQMTHCQPMCWERHSSSTNTSTNPAVTLEDLIIAAAANLLQALATNMPQHLRQSIIQALADLQDIFSHAASKYNDNPTMHHIPEANIPTAPQRQQLDNNQLQSPSRTPATPPRVQPRASFPRVPNDTDQSRNVSPRMHDAPLPSVTPTRLIFKHTVSPQPDPPKKPPSPKKQQHSQHIANVSILNKKPKTTALGAPAHNTRSQTQVQTIMQDAILVCIVT